MPECSLRSHRRTSITRHSKCSSWTKYLNYDYFLAHTLFQIQNRSKHRSFEVFPQSDESWCHIIYVLCILQNSCDSRLIICDFLVKYFTVLYSINKLHFMLNLKLTRNLLEWLRIVSNWTAMAVLYSKYWDFVHRIRIIVQVVEAHKKKKILHTVVADRPPKFLKQFRSTNRIFLFYADSQRVTFIAHKRSCYFFSTQKLGSPAFEMKSVFNYIFGLPGSTQEVLIYAGDDLYFEFSGSSLSSSERLYYQYTRCGVCQIGKKCFFV